MIWALVSTDTLDGHPLSDGRRRTHDGHDGHLGAEALVRSTDTPDGQMDASRRRTRPAPLEGAVGVRDRRRGGNIRLGGGCELCPAFTVLTPAGPDAWVVTIDHDNWCPMPDGEVRILKSDRLVAR